MLLEQELSNKTSLHRIRVFDDIPKDPMMELVEEMAAKGSLKRTLVLFEEGQGSGKSRRINEDEENQVANVEKPPTRNRPRTRATARKSVMNPTHIHIKKPATCSECESSIPPPGICLNSTRLPEAPPYICSLF